MRYNSGYPNNETAAALRTQTAASNHERDCLSMADSILSQRCFVYILTVPSGAVKIGIALNIRTRIAEIQTGNHQKISLAHSIETTSTVIAGRIESILHQHFSSSRLEGEWFLITPEQAIRALSLVKATYEVAQIIDDTPPFVAFQDEANAFPMLTNMLCACGCGTRFDPATPAQLYVNRSHRAARFKNDKKAATYAVVEAVIRWNGVADSEKRARIAVGHRFGALCRLFDEIGGYYDSPNRAWRDVFEEAQTLRIWEWFTGMGF